MVLGFEKIGQKFLFGRLNGGSANNLDVGDDGGNLAARGNIVLWLICGHRGFDKFDIRGGGIVFRA